MPEECPHRQQREGQIALLKTKCFHCYVPLLIAEGVCASCGSKQPVSWELRYWGWPAGTILPHGDVKVPAIVVSWDGDKKQVMLEERVQQILG